MSAAGSLQAARLPQPSLELHSLRQSSLDLEIAGDVPGVPPGEVRYLAREALLALPQVAYTVAADANFTRPVKIGGVPLEVLSRSLSAHPAADMIVAIASDLYRAYYPRDYVAAHHPLLVLSIDGHPPSGWPQSPDGADMGPYLISYAKFTSRYKILSQPEEAQIPWGVVRIDFRDERQVLAAIAPRGPLARDSAIQAGYRIAAQNCFRCHNMGNEGGQKSGIAWTAIAQIAAGDPRFFAAYVRDPAAQNSRTQMEANPNYDAATMRVLTTYFRTFATPDQSKAPRSEGQPR